jgi:beta-galactosidase
MNAKRKVLMAAIIACVLMLNISCQPMGGRPQKAGVSPQPSGRQVLNFNRDWKFAKGEQSGAKAADFNDSAWQAVRLPHDWAISGPFDPNQDGSAGKLPWWGVGWYRKTFTLDKADTGRRVYFDFDGVMAFPKVFINGQLAGGWDYGYMSFRVDATPYVKFGGENVIAVQADTRKHGTRWYPGAGIYRKVTMTICEQIHIAHWGTYVTTSKVSDKSAMISVRSTVENHLDTKSKVSVEVVLLDPDGKMAATLKVKGGAIPAGGPNDFSQSFITMPSVVIANPQRWDITSPKLYTAQTIIRLGDKIVDTDKTTFGIRSFEFTANDGFHLNGKRVQLYGVCLHHDHGALGGAFYTRAMERQLEIMRDMGVNAIRTSHNPPAPELLELCDKMGFVVWDECFDKWDGTADRIGGQPPLEQYGEKQIRNFVMRDRNHPSVVVWSIGNEIGPQPGDKEGVSAERIKFMSDFVRKYDATRPVGMACNVISTATQRMLEALDLTGWNYTRKYARAKQAYPDKPLVYSESASAFGTRGFYELPPVGSKTQYSKQVQISSYGRNAANWSDIPDVEFNLMEKDKYVAGEFVWTGFDYLGEPTPYNKQARSSYFGIVDLAGIPKDSFYLYRSHWAPEKTTVHILPHWNWPDRIGQNVPVYVYTNGDSAELFLNGKSLGWRTKMKEAGKPENFAKGKPAKASSEESDKDNLTAYANDSDVSTRWCAANADANQWWQVDLGEVQQFRYINIEFEKEAKNYQYQIKTSTDGSTWQTIVDKNDWTGDTSQAGYNISALARFLQIEFTGLKEGCWASIREFGVYPMKADQPYYAVIYKYRLCFDDVVYEPGELKAVAYKDGKEIGQAVMRTAGEPAAIRLTPDRKELLASGEDLCYILVEAIDANGTLCPLADNSIKFKVDGPAEIAGIDNGNPMSFEPFGDDVHKLFFGKAMLILRTKEGQALNHTVQGQGGSIRVTAESDGLKQAEVTVQSK